MRAPNDARPNDARHLLVRLDLPREAEVILHRPEYWNVAVCEGYFELCEEWLYHAPEDALEAAEIAPRLALILPEEGGEQGRLRHRERLVRGYAILGGACRAAGRHRASERAYAQALRAGRQGISQALRCQLDRWMAYLRCAQHRLEEALELADRAVELSDSDNARGGALVVRGYVHVRMGYFSDGVRDFSKALSMIDLDSDPANRRRLLRVRYAATHNLAHAISRSPSPESLETARSQLRRARQLMPAHGRSLPRHQLCWLEGQCLIKLGSARHGEALLRRAREGFRDVGAPFEMALAGLDLSELYRKERRWAELAELASDTFQRFERLSADTEAVAALSLWLKAAGRARLGGELIHKVRCQLDAARGRHPLPGRD